ncbi:MAG: insulinase family protein [Proteobacteria bacterium]|nr:insulinase family protein [Pseudomonadota bacterium]
MKINDPFNPTLDEGNLVTGYRCCRKVSLKEIESVFYELEHIETGCRHIHISNSDPENTFSVAFKTVPKDSTGVAHILEHTVLCGSKKFPVRDPFFSMIKRSLNTFMNAFTSSDWTMYPFSSQNKKDYYNLMDVYLDATFFPAIGELSFKQEGHRLDIEKDGSLLYKGVVYNEMKGAMSSPSQVMGRALLNALYPTTTYGWNSGGDPAIIPHLTWDQLKTFHQSHYHPSNAYFYTYGNLPLSEHLRFIESKILRSFERIDPKTEVLNEPRWETPRQTTYFYPLDKQENTGKKSQICVAWLTADINRSFDVLSLSLLGHILMGNSASPLRKALIDSKLGSALCDASGFDSDNRDTMFACGLKDVDPNDAEEIEAIIFKTLNDLASNGVEKELVDTAIHQIEFRRKERTNTPYPYGIKLLLGISGVWFHGGDTINALMLDNDLATLREELDKGPFFENLIRRNLLENTHRVRFTLAPDQTLEEKETSRVKKELDEIKVRLTPAELDKIKSDNQKLESLQDSEENLSCLPTLQITDIPKDVAVMAPNQGYDAIPVTCYKQPTSGIFYLAAAAGISKFSTDQLPLVPFFCSTLTRMGTRKRDYSSLARIISAKTGGIGLSSNARTCYGEHAGCLPFVSFSGKCLNRNLDPFFDIIQECFFHYDFSDLERLKSLLLEYRAGLESAVVQNGHALAMSLASRHFSDTCRINEIWHGIGQLKHIKDLCLNLKDPAEEKDMLTSLAGSLKQMADLFFSRDNFKFALVGEDEAIRAAQKGISPLSDKLGIPGDSTIHQVNLDPAPHRQAIREGWSTNSAVSFVAASWEVVPLSHPDAPALAVISKILRSKYLHREIREKGGAYGGFAIYNPEDGLFSLGSYRDPHIVNTIKVFEETGQYLNSNQISDEDVTEAILQVCSHIDKPDTPGPAARKAFYRSILSLTDQMRLDYKANLLAVTRRDLGLISEKYFIESTTPMSVAVISGEEKLGEANKKLGENALTLHRI